MRFASIDVGTNSVLLLVAERDAQGRFTQVVERAEITRLGKGVDRSRTLSAEGLEATVAVLEAYAKEARALGAERIVASATSAARDASNGHELLSLAKSRAGVDIEVISGDEEARLSFASAVADFGRGGPVVAIDIGGGSTEVVVGDAKGGVKFRHSFDVGSVRLTERFVKSDPPTAERAAVEAYLKQVLASVPAPPPGATVVGIAGTVTTVCAVGRAIEPYDATRVHGATLSRDEVHAVADRLWSMPLEQRRTLPGLQPKRADVIPSGAQVLVAVLDALGAESVTVSDRGLRWGLLVDRCGVKA